jgi:hypothetical protein
MFMDLKGNVHINEKEKAVHTYIFNVINFNLST